jgi:hypothetical protein
MTDDTRALCAELLAALKSWSPHGGGPLECWEDREEEADLIARAETELAQPVAERPTVMEIIELHTWMEDEWRANNDGEDLPMVDYARAVLAKWGNQ